MKYFVFLLGFYSGSGFTHDSHSGQEHHKPGAKISLNHDYDGQSEAGVFEQIDLHFRSSSLANGKIIKVHFNPSVALELVEGLNFEVTITDQVARIPITISARHNGKHYLGIHAEVEEAGHRSFRVFELPIQVGNRVEQTQLAQKTRHSGGRNILVLKTRESIRRAK